MTESEEYDVGVSDLEDARRVIRDSQTSADRLIRASRELEHIVYGVSREESSFCSSVASSSLRWSEVTKSAH